MELGKLYVPDIVTENIQPASRCPFDDDCVVPQYEGRAFTVGLAEEFIYLRTRGRICPEHAQLIPPLIAVICEDRERNWLTMRRQEQSIEERERIAGTLGNLDDPPNLSAARILRRVHLRHHPWNLLQRWVEAGLPDARQKWAANR